MTRQRGKSRKKNSREKTNGFATQFTSLDVKARVELGVHRELPNRCHECFGHFRACDLSAAGQTWRQIIAARLVFCNVLSQSDSHAIRICYNELGSIYLRESTVQRKERLEKRNCKYVMKPQFPFHKCPHTIVLHNVVLLT